MQFQFQNISFVQGTKVLEVMAVGFFYSEIVPCSFVWDLSLPG